MEEELDLQHAGALNPFRYRGYIWDEETGLYYLKSRYYNPEWCRFINFDAVAGVTGVLFSHNAAAYAFNSPLGYGDQDGEFLGALIGGIVGAAFGALNAAINHEDIGKGALGGAVSGAIAGLGCDIAVSTCGAGAPVAVGLLISGGFGAAGGIAGEAISNPHPDTVEYVDALVAGALGNMMCFGFSKVFASGLPMKNHKECNSWIKAIAHNMHECMGWKVSAVKDFNFVMTTTAGNGIVNMISGSVTMSGLSAVRAIRVQNQSTEPTIAARPRPYAYVARNAYA